MVPQKVREESLLSITGPKEAVTRHPKSVLWIWLLLRTDGHYPSDSGRTKVRITLSKNDKFLFKGLVCKRQEKHRPVVTVLKRRI